MRWRWAKAAASLSKAWVRPAAWQDGTEWRALRDQQFTYAIYKRDGKELLFNNAKDPYQLRNLAEERATARQYYPEGIPVQDG